MNLFYVHKCLGKKSRSINVYKIRTMKPDADKQFDDVIKSGLDSLGKPLNDPRITPMGKFLRKYRIDELPQIYNFGRGDLKLVGIRPMSREEWQNYPTEIMQKALSQKPSLIPIQYAYPYSKRFEDDLRHMTEYLDRWENTPIRADIEFFYRVAWNIIFNRGKSH